eukprot:gnl/Chilomastix_caulleri/663.p1 GENE.gnl/Chilomastix_caulleri/663~~gnl/Chilomastix_caulleri/663.p1  ORF type:complete len:275 (+),score=127.33 gnl/Chilomastix_caulleri/663:156-980(+)
MGCCESWYFVCLNCSGQHRNAGAHISKVKSATLDDWEPEEVAFMGKMGNVKANSILCANLPPGQTKPLASDDRGREKWIKMKYVQRKWVGQPTQVSSPNQAPIMATQQPSRPQYTQQGFGQPAAQQQPQQPQLQQRQQYQQYQQPISQPSSQVSSPFSSFTPTTQPQWSQQQPKQPQAPTFTSGFVSQPSFTPANQQWKTQQPQMQQQQQQPKYVQNPVQPSRQPMVYQQQPIPVQTGGSMLIDFTGPVKQQPKPIDPHAGDQLMSCFGGQPKW